MAYTVKQVAAMSGISVRTLHFYDETGLLKPAYTGTNGYRFYEEPQLPLCGSSLIAQTERTPIRDLSGAGSRCAHCGNFR